MLMRKRRRRAAASADRSPSGRTRVLGVLAGGALVTVFGAQLTRLWRLGTLPRGRQERDAAPSRLARVTEPVTVLREGYAVSRTRENALVNTLASFTVTFAITRGITWQIRHHGGLGPIRDVTVGDRHIHHFIPGGLLALAAGGAAIGSRDMRLDRYLALPYGIGVALVLDESALLLELEDVYWTEEGVLSVQIAFVATALLAALAYLIENLRHKEVDDAESDWEIAASAWDDLQAVGRGSHPGRTGPEPRGPA